MTTYVADANILISLLDPDNALHAVSIGLIADCGSGLIYVHPLNLAEVLSFYETTLAREQHWAALQQAARFEVADTDQTPLAQALGLAEMRHLSRQHMPDVCALALAHRTASTLLTHDVRLAKAARQLGLPTLPVVTP